MCYRINVAWHIILWFLRFEFISSKASVKKKVVCYYIQNSPKALIIKGDFITNFDSLSMVTLTLNVLRNVSIMLNRRNKLSKHAKPISNKLKEFLISENKVLWNICCWNNKYTSDFLVQIPMWYEYCFSIPLSINSHWLF